MNKGYMEYHIKLDVNVNNISFKNMHGSSLCIRKDIKDKPLIIKKVDPLIIKPSTARPCSRNGGFYRSNKAEVAKRIFEIKEETTPITQTEITTPNFRKYRLLKTATYRTKSEMKKMGRVSDQISPLKPKTPRIRFTNNSIQSRYFNSNSELKKEKNMFCTKIIKLINKLDDKTCQEFCKTVGCSNILEFVKPLELTEDDLKQKEIIEKGRKMKRVIEKFKKFNKDHFNCDFLYS